MRVPRLFSHVFDNKSKSVTFGYAVYAGACYGAFFARDAANQFVLSADNWLFATAFASVLVGGKLAAETMGARWGIGKPDAESPPAPSQ